jgi:DNA-binding IclR family transcriptional regulator
MKFENKSEEMRATILQHFKDNQGNMIRIADLAKTLGIGFSSAKAVLVDLHNSGAIRKSNGDRARYWMPTPEQVAQEQQTMARTAPMHRPPMKPRTQHAAVLQRIAEERNAIRSKG